LEPSTATTTRCALAAIAIAVRASASSNVVAPTSADIPSAPSTAVPTVTTWNACSDIGPTASRVFALTKPPVAITFMWASTAQSAAIVSEFVTIVI
jgi:hypothetical protein